MAKNIWREEDEIGKQDQEYRQRKRVFHRNIGVKGYGILLAFDGYAYRVVIARHMQSPDVQDHNAKNKERQEIMQ